MMQRLLILTFLVLFSSCGKEEEKKLLESRKKLTESRKEVESLERQLSLIQNQSVFEHNNSKEFTFSDGSHVTCDYSIKFEYIRETEDAGKIKFLLERKFGNLSRKCAIHRIEFLDENDFIIFTLKMSHSLTENVPDNYKHYANYGGGQKFVKKDGSKVTQGIIGNLNRSTLRKIKGSRIMVIRGPHKSENKVKK